jgi:hypothetical protein
MPPTKPTTPPDQYADEYADEYAGQGGSYTIDATGRRRLVERTQPAGSVQTSAPVDSSTPISPEE